MLTDDQCQWLPLVAEIKEAVNKLIINKSSVLDNITAELIKEGKVYINTIYMPYVNR